MKIGILESKDFSLEALNKLYDYGDVEIFKKKDFNKFIHDKDIIFIRLEFYLDKKFLNLAKNLKYICTPTTGLNHIDLRECEKKEIEIISLKGEYKFLSTIRATPEHTFGLVLSLLRNYKSAFLSQKNNKWDREKYKGFELYENFVGIVGFGRVGKILSKYFKCFGVKVYFYDIDNSIDSANSAIKLNSINELISKSNIVILSASYNEDYYEFFDKKYIDLLENKYFISTARGELIDEGYLMQKIEKDYFKGIAIDVMQDEQLKDNNFDKLLKLSENKNFIITPHIAGATYSSMHRTEEFIVKKLTKYLT